MKQNSIWSWLIILTIFAAGSCKKTDDTVTPTTTPALNCTSTAFTTSAFTSNGTAQSTTLTVGVSNATAGSATFAIASSSSDFTPATYTTTLTAGQTTVAIPLAFDGTSSATSETVTVTTSGYASGTCTAVATITSGTSSTTATAGTTVANVVAAANAFLATLSTTQQTTVQLALTKANAIKWSNLPGGVTIRNGLEFSTLTAAQLTAAKAVIQAAAGTTANEGYSEFSQINAADDVLGTTGGSGYSSGKYIIAFLGTPSATGTWMLQFGGHHYAQNITYSGGAVVSATPSHQGVEPRSWTSSGTTYAPLNQEHDAMIAMLASLSTAQLTSAKLSTTFSDVLLGPNKDGQFPATKQGLAVSTLTDVQKALVLAAIKPWTQDVDDATGTALLAIYANELNSTYIAYSGNITMEANADYARIDGPSVWVEFVCQSGVVIQNQIHYHTIFRDHTRDYNGL